jgi:hypothetical protein
MRKKKRAPLTEYAETLILCKLEKWRIESNADVIAILNESIERGWSGVFLNGHRNMGQDGYKRADGVTRENGNAAMKFPVAAPPVCCICKRPLNGSFIYCSGGKRCHEC